MSTFVYADRFLVEPMIITKLKRPLFDGPRDRRNLKMKSRERDKKSDGKAKMRFTPLSSTFCRLI